MRRKPAAKMSYEDWKAIYDPKMPRFHKTATTPKLPNLHMIDTTQMTAEQWKDYRAINRWVTFLT